MNMIGTPYSPNAKRAVLLGSGELGKEIAIELLRLGVEVWACDRYEHAPAMQVAQHCRVFNMLNPTELRQAIKEIDPHLIIPEVEALATKELLALEEEGYRVIPTARAVHLTMDREGIRKLAAEKLGISTAKFLFASNFEEFKTTVLEMGMPCVVKPIMSSSGKGQSIVYSSADIEPSWQYSQEGGRTGKGKVIIEEFIPFESEITLLTIKTVSGTIFCDPIGHRQSDGDYIESWQPHSMSLEQIREAQDIAAKITTELGGVGLFGVELFLLKDGRVLFSEVSPRPHDTGMVTMANQKWSQFALHARAILGLPITKNTRFTAAASIAIRSEKLLNSPVYSGLEEFFSQPDVDLRIFGKPNASPKRRLAVILATADSSSEALSKARSSQAFLKITDA